MKVFYDRNYAILLALRLHEDKLWHRTTWTGVSERLLPFVHRARGPAAVRPVQMQGKKKLAFGRLGLDEKSSAKWVHESPATTGEQWKFVSAEVWAPHWNACVREGLAPDVFAALSQPFSSAIGFNQAVLLAVEEGLVEVSRGELEEFARFLGSLSGMRLLARTKRPWGEGIQGESGYSNAIQSFLYTGLYYPHMKWPVDLERTRWRGWVSSFVGAAEVGGG
jgi:hypothetical protein